MNYSPRPQQRRRKKRQEIPMPFICFVLVWLAILGIIFITASVKNKSDKLPDDSKTSSTDKSTNSGDGTDNNNTDAATQTGEVLTTPEPVTYTEATLLSAGDLIVHMAQVNYAEAVGAGSYDFTNSFKYIKSLVSSVDYAVVNFETTLAGPSVAYSGYPRFNAPDTILDAAKNAGFDMMLFANNHCYDTGLDGLLRTQEQFTAHGLSYIGAKKQAGDKAYDVVEINGIKVGMLNYADDLSGGKTDRRTINGIAIKNNDIDYMNLYNLSLLDEFYNEIDTIISSMRSDGVDIIIAYMHWGAEYNIKNNSRQSEVAQALCDRGVDVIIGGHPHVIQGADVLTDTSGNGHKTLCFYSLGNLVSNQNRRTLDDTMNSNYTEAGLMVTLTLRKYSTGEAYVVSAEQIPTFVHRYKASNGKYAHEIVPLKEALADPSAYGLTASSYGKKDAEEMYALETSLLGDTVAAFNDSVVLPAIAGE